MGFLRKLKSIEKNSFSGIAINPNLNKTKQTTDSMKEAVKKEILYNLTQAIQILEVKEDQDTKQLKQLSNHAIEDVALTKDLDIISITVLLYSIYKVLSTILPENYAKLIRHLKGAKRHLEQKNYGGYNRNIRASFALIKTSSTRVKTHFQDVMQAAKIKKGTVLLQKGLSIGQAAGLMGLSNWDLQEFAGKTVTLGQHERIQITKRIQTAFKIFGVQ